MNGIPVYPLPKNGERPYLAPPKTQFSDLFFGYFWGIQAATPAYFLHPNPTPTYPPTNIIPPPTTSYFIHQYIQTPIYVRAD